jgi:hypothetical protein
MVELVTGPAWVYGLIAACVVLALTARLFKR